MSGKRPRKDGTSRMTKRTRKSISLEQKLEVLSRYDRGESTASLKRELGMSESTLRGIRDSADRIKSSAKVGVPLTARRSSYTRDVVFERMEKMLSTWINDMKHVNVSIAHVQAKALSIYEDIKASEPDPAEVKPFSASAGWYMNFKKRYGLQSARTSRAAPSLDPDAARQFPVTLNAIIEEGGYSEKQIFKLDETGLFWKKLPEETNLSLEEEMAAGFKASKDKVTLLLGANADGHKLKPMVVYHSANPHALKGLDRNLLPVHWYSSQKGRMTAGILRSYFTGQLRHELELYCKQEGIPFKILIVLNSTSTCPVNLVYACPDIKVVFLPPFTSALLQSLDQDVFRFFKIQYLRCLLDDMLRRSDGDILRVKEYWRAFSIKDAVNFIDISWQEVKRTCIQSSFYKMCPLVFPIFEGFSEDNYFAKMVEHCVRLVTQLRLGEIQPSDITNWMENHEQELSSDELSMLTRESQQELEDSEIHSEEQQGLEQHLSLDRLTRFLTLIDEALDIVFDDDPNMERSSRVRHQVLQDVSCYREMLREMMQHTAQTTPNAFFKKKQLPVSTTLPWPEEPSTSGASTGQPVSASPSAAQLFSVGEGEELQCLSL